VGKARGGGPQSYTARQSRNQKKFLPQRRKGAKGQRKAQRETPKKNLICPLRLYLCAFAPLREKLSQENKNIRTCYAEDIFQITRY
jgi:hypothetical protein